MFIRYSPELECHSWTCVYGHFGWGYSTDEEAVEAFLEHDCVY